MQPLHNKDIIIAAMEKTALKMESLLKEKGANPYIYPVIEICPVTEISQELTDAFQNLKEYSYILFTSQNGVLHFFSLLKQITGAIAIPDSVKIITYGKQTTSEIEKYNLKADSSFGCSTAIEIAEPLKKIIAQNEKILLILGNLAKPDLQQRLSEFAVVNRMDVYYTKKVKSNDISLKNKIIENKYDIIAVTSSSAVQSLVDDFTTNIPFKFASIGKSTTKTIEEIGLNPVLTAETSTAEGLINEIEKYFTINSNKNY